MNAQCFKTIFSKRLGCLVAVGEHATSQGKANGASAVLGAPGMGWGGFVGVLAASFAAVSLAWAAPANNALPTGAQVAQGGASISTSGATMNIQQTTAKAVVNWNSFDIGKDARVNIHQPGADSLILNRVTGANPSQIFGQLSANGQVVLVNPNGVLFGRDGSATATSFTASTLGITDANFMAGNMQFERNGSTAGVVNQGSIRANGGYVALLGASVSNEGRIETNGGTAYLAAAEAVRIPVSGSGRIKLELSPSQINARVANTKEGTIVTQGGQVYMQAAALQDAVASIVQSGSIDTTGEQGGAVHVLADGGHIKVDGSIKANSTNAANKGGDIIIGRDKDTNVLAAVGDASGAKLESKGGFVETSGDYLVTTGTRVIAKDWLLDPTNIRIVGAGTTTATSSNSGGIFGTTTFDGPAGVSDSLVFRDDIQNAINAGTSVKIDTANSTPGANGSGNITIETALSFDNNTTNAATLSLLAKNGITQNENAAITNTGSGLVHVVMTAEGLPGGTPITLGTNNTSSLGITLNSTIKTNGDVTITGTTANNAQNGVRFNNNSGIEARSYNVTGRMTANSGGSQGGAQGSGVQFSGTTNFKSSSNSSIIGSTASTAVFGVQFHNPSNTTFDTGAGKLLVATDAANMGGGVKIGWAGGATVNTKGDVTLGSLNNNAGMHLQGTVNASGNDKNTVGSIKLLGRGAGGGIFAQDGGGVPGKVIATGATTIDIEGVSTGAAHGVNLGITLGSPISSESGKITIKGSTTTSTGFSGVLVQNNTAITSNSGDIDIVGNSASNGDAAVRLQWGTVNTGGNITVTGTSTTAGALGVWTDNAKVTGSNVTVSGTSVSAAGVHLGNGVDASVNGLFEANGAAPETGLLKVTGLSQSGTAVQSQSGMMKATKNIVIDAQSGTGNGVVMTGTNGITSTGGDVTIKTDSLNLATTAVGITSTSGLVSIQNKTAGTWVNVGGNDVLTGSKTLGINNAELNKIAATKTEIGSSTAGNLTVNSAVTSLNATGDLTLISGANIAINQELKVGASGDKNLTLKAGGTSVGGTGKVTANKLTIDAANAAVAMASLANQVNQLVANVKSLEFKNGNALDLQGITASGKIKIETTTGDLNLKQAVTTTLENDADAVILNAGSATGFGTDTGGNIVADNGVAVSVGSGSTAKLYTGSIAGSENMKELAGPGRYRYNSNEDKTNFTQALGQGVNVIYREKPTLTVNLNAFKTYDGMAYSGGNGLTETTPQGLKNDDQLAAAIATAVFGGEAQGAKNAGTYTLSASESDPVKSALGYGITYNNGKLTIAKADLTVSLADQTKVYDGNNAAALAAGSITAKGVTVNGVTEVATVNKASANYNDKNVVGATTVSTTLDAADFTSGTANLNNYKLPTSVTGKGTITPRPLTIGAGTVADKNADGTTAASVTPGALGNLVAGESLGVSVASANFSDANAGTGKVVTAIYKLSDGANGLASNYVLNAATPNPDNRLRGNILAASVNPVSPVVPPTKPSSSSRVVVSGSGSAGAAVGVADDELDTRKECSILNPEKCECQESTIPGVELCYAPSVVLNTTKD